MKKILFIFVLATLIWACGGSEDSTTGSKAKKLDTSGIDGAEIYKTYCVACHLKTGEGGVNGSKDLRKSALNLEGRVEMITNGSKENPTMIAYSGQLSPKEIQAVAEYTMTLK